MNDDMSEAPALDAPQAATPAANVTQPSTAGAYIAQYDLAFQISPIILQGGIAAKAQGGLYNTATTGLGDANKTLSQFGLASYGPWMSALSAAGGAGAAALAPWMKGVQAASQMPSMDA